MLWIPKNNELTTCPFCGAERIPDQPYPGLHAFTLLYECGTDLTILIGYDGETVIEKRCDTKFMNVYEDDLYHNLRDRYIQMADDTPSAERVIGMMNKIVENHDSWPPDKTGRWVGYVQCMLIEVEKVTTVKEERDYTRPFFHEIYSLAGYEIPETVEI